MHIAALCQSLPHRTTDGRVQVQQEQEGSLRILGRESSHSCGDRVDPGTPILPPMGRHENVSGASQINR